MTTAQAVPQSGAQSSAPVGSGGSAISPVTILSGALALGSLYFGFVAFLTVAFVAVMLNAIVGQRGVVGAIARRELRGYFGTPVAYVFLVVFLVLAAYLTLSQNRFLDAGNCDLRPFFEQMPWLFALFAPAIAMRMWAEERRSGTVELLLTLPITVRQAVLGKFLAGWFFFVVALTLATLPMGLTVAYLGDPDWGPVFTGYLGSVLMAGGYLSIGTYFSTLTKNQVIAFILGALGCALFVVFGNPSLLNVLSSFGVGSSFLESLSFMTQFDGMKRGVLEFGAVASLLGLTAAFLAISCVSLDQRKAS